MYRSPPSLRLPIAQVGASSSFHEDDQDDCNQRKFDQKNGGNPGIEPGTPRTQSEDYTIVGEAITQNQFPEDYL